MRKSEIDAGEGFLGKTLSLVGCVGTTLRERAEKGKDNVVEGKGCRVAKGPTGSLGNAWTVRTEWTEAEDKLDRGTDCWHLSFIFPLAAGLFGWGTMPH